MAVVSALQIGSRQEGTGATLAHLNSYAKEIRSSGSDLVVMPEALLGGYSKGADVGARLGFRMQAGRDLYRAYLQDAICVPGPETDLLAELSRSTGAFLIVGVIEREGHSLFCTALFVDPSDGLVGVHRKLMPTGSERLIWALGDGSTMPVIETMAGRAGAAICWENYMPLFRSAMYAKGVEIWCAPTVDDRDQWQSSMRHIACEGRNFLVSACQFQPSPSTSGIEVEGWPNDRPLIRGGSVIVSPLGDILAGPMWGREGLVTSEIDLNRIAEARYDLDLSGHYARPDIFSLEVDERRKRNVKTLSAAMVPAPDSATEELGPCLPRGRSDS